ncbi:MAG TPA: GreA/GreB family elongation factor [Polyangiaceae bacterium]|jgi:transcription elongation GreA/GreB family factor|nr:GreA/GreB family elongation factor [Polyangiaceae bacterium]
MPELDKSKLLDALRAQLASELARSKARALDAAEGATHEENRAEGDKDMRSTEASYVARGHAERTALLEQALAQLATLELRDFSKHAPVASSALVELEHASKRMHYFLVPAAGGERLSFQGVEVHTLTPSSPLGAALLGLSEGDEAEVSSPQGVRFYELIRVR